MKILDVVQGSPEWHAARAKHNCASDAPTMMGVGKYMTRDELIRARATGGTREVSAELQRLYDNGHAAEARARTLLEAELGEDLYPATIADDAEWLLASYDGITMDGATGFEHKLWNEDLAAAVRSGELPPAYYWQLEQQILIAGLERVIFVVSDGTLERREKMIYTPVPGRATQLVAGWKQFDVDVKSYQHVEVLPSPVAAPVMALPALSIRVDGAIALQHNLPAFGERLQGFIDGIDKNPSDDQAFADAENAVKVLQNAQDALEEAERNALAQTASIDEMRRTIEMLRNLARNTRLNLEKLVKARKDTLRDEIRRGGIDALAAHLAALNLRIGKPYMTSVPTDFAGAMKGKKTITSLRDAVNTEIARAKIAANEIADRITINLNTLRELAPNHAFLFADTAQIVLKDNADLTALVKVRIAEHEQAEAKRKEEEQRREQERQERAAAPQAAPQAAQAPAAPQAAQMATQHYAAPAPKPRLVAGAAGPRPTDEAIIAVLAQHYRVHESKVIEWLLAMDLKAASNRMVATI